jgi:hypothetical protein
MPSFSKHFLYMWQQGDQDIRPDFVFQFRQWSILRGLHSQGLQWQHGHVCHVFHCDKSVHICTLNIY